ncbi:uncharacterized protein LTR77_001494 [Saxophila tyrrhenica]|uniref:Tubulin-specific chaperone A n=1 Tax=Saxophila tyrrhenica TaxID=1690608 RepID=A0AAV9PNU9_9PEZI|nr:hypothetical protein LTR77_001494 [Saxophila tyrrhenica]
MLQIQAKIREARAYERETALYEKYTQDVVKARRCISQSDKLGELANEFGESLAKEEKEALWVEINAADEPHVPDGHGG